MSSSPRTRLLVNILTVNRAISKATDSAAMVGLSATQSTALESTELQLPDNARPKDKSQRYVGVSREIQDNFKACSESLQRYSTNEHDITPRILSYMYKTDLNGIYGGLGKSLPDLLTTGGLDSF